MAAIAAETRSELIDKLNRIRAELEALEREGKTEENCEEARLLEEQADLVMDVLDLEKIEKIMNDPNDPFIPYEQVRKELGLD